MGSGPWNRAASAASVSRAATLFEPPPLDRIRYVVGIAVKSFLAAYKKYMCRVAGRLPLSISILAFSGFRARNCQMRTPILVIAIIAAVSPALAATYPISGRWGVNPPPAKGAVDCSNLRVIAFSGNQRTDSDGGVPAYRNYSVTRVSGTLYQVVDEFTTGQISNARVDYTLRKVDGDHVELDMRLGGLLKLQRCK
jgi:hypothetical protein